MRPRREYFVKLVTEEEAAALARRIDAMVEAWERMKEEPQELPQELPRELPALSFARRTAACECIGVMTLLLNPEVTVPGAVPLATLIGGRMRQIIDGGPRMHISDADLAGWVEKAREMVAGDPAMAALEENNDGA